MTLGLFSRNRGMRQCRNGYPHDKVPYLVSLAICLSFCPMSMVCSAMPTTSLLSSKICTKHVHDNEDRDRENEGLGGVFL